MPSLFPILLLIFIQLLSFDVAAEEPLSQARDLIQEAHIKQLANHPYWLKLLHYKSSDGAYTSEITSPEFFISPEGRNNPDAELVATLNTLFEAAPDNPDNHAQCRFIARYKWLKKELDWRDAHPPAITCKRFDDWTLHGHVESLSLVFVTGYLSNPASFYGHILLKANPDRAVIPVSLLDQSVNYGAIVPDKENPVLYVFKGLFGGYQATFSSAQFYRHNHNYGENELRDMWEYELALNRDEIDQVLSHAWELLGKEFTYHFTRENCAYRMSGLLELVIEEPLFPRESPWVMPITIFDHLAVTKIGDTPLVKRIQRIPSRQNRFYSGYSKLSEPQKRVASAIAHKEIDTDHPRFINLAENERGRILDTLIDYYEFLILTEEDDADFRQNKTALLIQRSTLRKYRSHDEESSDKEAPPPHLGALPSMTRAGWLHNNTLGTGVELRFRPAYYDLLTPNAGDIPYSKLTMFELAITRIDEKVEIRNLTLVDIETLNLSQTHLPGDGGFAWKLKFGFDKMHLGCTDCTIFNINGGIGLGASLAEQTAIYGMVEPQIQTDHQNSGTVAATARLSLLSEVTDQWKSGLSIGHKKYINHSRDGYRLVKWENRFGVNRHWDVRINYEKNIAREFSLAASFYW